jgi:acyl-CoA synthetase (NDP forming)
MGTQKVALEIIEDFLAQKRIAMINPGAAEVIGRPCFARVQDIQPPVDGVLLMTSPAVTEAVVEDCAEAGIRRVWMYSAGGTGCGQPQGCRVLPCAGDSGSAGRVSLHVSSA